MQCKLLEIYDQATYNNNIPDAWRQSTVIHIFKPGKASHLFVLHRPISLISCVVKCLDNIGHRRLAWLPDHLADLPPEMSDFRQQRCRDDAIMNLSLSLEEARTCTHTAHVVFIDMHRAFDAPPPATVVSQLRRNRVCDRVVRYIEVFLNYRVLQVKTHDATSSPRLFMQGVPQVRGHSPSLLNAALADLRKHFPRPTPLLLHVGIYANDILVVYCSN